MPDLLGLGLLGAVLALGTNPAAAASCHVRNLAEVPRCHRGNPHARTVWAREMVGRREPAPPGGADALALEQRIIGEAVPGRPDRDGPPFLLRLPPGGLPGSGATHLLIGRGGRLALLRPGSAGPDTAEPLALGEAGDLAACEVPPGTVEERAQFDGEPGALLPSVGVVRLGSGPLLRLTWRVTEGYAGGGASADAAQLVRLAEGRLRPAGCFLVASYADLAGDWNRDRSRQRHVHTSGWQLTTGRVGSAGRPALRSTTDRLPPIPLTWDASAGLWRLAPPRR